MDNLEVIEKMSVSAFARRRLLVVLKILKLVETLNDSQKYIEHGHIKIGNQIVKDCDFLVPRNLEEHIEWNDKSKIKRKIEAFKNQADDYDL